MFNFSANHMVVVSSKEYEKANTYIMMDNDSKRCYKVYDYKKTFSFEKNQAYCISGKINSTDKLYLILENAKEDKYSFEVGKGA